MRRHASLKPASRTPSRVRNIDLLVVELIALVDDEVLFAVLAGLGFHVPQYLTIKAN